MRWQLVLRVGHYSRHPELTKVLYLSTTAYFSKATNPSFRWPFPRRAEVTLDDIGGANAEIDRSLGARARAQKGTPGQDGPETAGGPAETEMAEVAAEKCCRIEGWAEWFERCVVSHIPDLCQCSRFSG